MAPESPKTRFVGFDRYTVVYKTVNGHDITAEILVPKNIHPGSHPLLVQFHGGGLYTGAALYADWFSPYLASLALKHSAIVVSPNYRLIPESNGDDIISDLASFWAWLPTFLPDFLASTSPGLAPDFSHLLLGGESAGGWMALQSALTLPEGYIKAMLLPFPMSRPMPGAGKTDVMGMPVPSNDSLNDFLATLKPGAVVSRALPPARMAMGMAIIEHGRMGEFLGTGKRFNPFEGIDDARHFPRMWVLHGADDSIVPTHYSVELLEKVERMFPGKARLTVKPGEHGFDLAHSPEKDEWMKEGLDWVVEAWL